MKKILLLLLCMACITGCSNKNDVVIYTSMEEERNQDLSKQLKEEFPELNIAVQYMATGNSAAKIKNEGTSVEADIVIDLETSHMENLKENFADLSAFDTSNYKDDVNKDSNYVVWTKSSSGLIIDKKYFDSKKLAIPKTYEDLLKKEYKDIIAMPDPKTSGTGYSFYLNVVNIMGEDEAIEYFKKLKENVREFTTSGSGPINLLKQGEIAVAMGMIYQGVQSINEGYEFEISLLESGAPYNTTSAGIIRGREENENVRKVFDWIIHDFIKYDTENYLPSKLLKDQASNIENFPENIIDADMKNVENMQVKENLTGRWEEING